MENNGLNIIPNKNLVENIGFGPNATNTLSYKKFNESDEYKFMIENYPEKML